MSVWAMSTFLYTLLGLTLGSSLHCAVRREISPCTCRPQEPAVLVACEQMASFRQVRDALAGKFPPDAAVALRVAHSHLDDLTDAGPFGDLGFVITSLKLNHDNLSLLPESVFTGLGRTEYLSLADNALPSVPEHVLRHMPLIKTLDLSRSRLGAITDEDFQSIPELQHLVLAGNIISELGKSCMPRGLRHLHIGRNLLTYLNSSLRLLEDLEWLFVNENLLTSLDDQLPPEGAKLTLLHAGHNKLLNLPMEFQNYVYLDSLFIHHNHIHNLGKTLQKTKKLKRLHVHHNKIDQLAEDEFADLENLEDLQLGHNMLSSLNGSLLPLRSLNILNLTHNQFEEFSLQEILGLRLLRVIDLSHNKITRLSGQMANMVELETRVTELRLEYNELQSLDGALMGLHGLQRLNLSNNKLNKIAPDDLIGLDDLRVLDISFNRLTTLEETSKTFLPSLEGLLASHNLLTALQEDFHGLPVLCWADLSFNNIHTVGHDLTSKTRCRVHGVFSTLRVYLEGNPIECTPQLEATIQAMSLNQTRLHGVPDCAIFNFTAPAAII